MPRKKASRKAARKPRREKRPTLNQRVKHFEEEVEKIGERFEKKVDKNGKGCEDWFNRNMGVVGPFLSSVLSLVCLGILILVLGFIGQFVATELLTNVNSFLTVNFGFFFLLFLLFSYLSYLSKVLRNGYWVIIPIRVAAGITVAVWLIIQAIMIVNITSGMVSEGASFMAKNLLPMFWFFLALGYLVVFVKVVSCCPMFEERRAVKGKYKRLYRSGKDRVLGGVCGGIAEYLGVDPVIIRVIWVVATIASLGIGILAYIAAWIIIPRNPKHKWK